MSFPFCLSRKKPAGRGFRTFRSTRKRRYRFGTTLLLFTELGWMYPTIFPIIWADFSCRNACGKPCICMKNVDVSKEISDRDLWLGHSFKIMCAPFKHHGQFLNIVSLSSLKRKLNLNIFSSSFSTETLALRDQVFEIISVIVYLLKLLVDNTFPSSTLCALNVTPALLGSRVKVLRESCNIATFS